MRQAHLICMGSIPQFVKQVGLTTSDSATISLATNLGSGVGGLPGGLIIDHFGPQKSILLGSVCIFIGYFAMHKITKPNMTIY